MMIDDDDDDDDDTGMYIYIYNIYMRHICSWVGAVVWVKQNQLTIPRNGWDEGRSTRET